MKIIHLVLLWGLGGTEEYLFHLLRHYPDKTVQHVVINGVPKEHIRPLDYPYLQKTLSELPIQTIQITSWMSIKEMVNLLQKEQCDVVHVVNPATFFLYAYVFNLCAGIPFVSVWHNPPVIESLRTISLKANFYRQAEQDGIPLYSLTPYACRGYEKAFGLTKVLPLGNGIDVAHFAFSQKKREKIRSEHNIPQDALVIGSVGRVDLAWKRQDWLIESLEQLHAQGLKNVYALIVGGGSDLELLKKRAEDSGVKEYVRCVGLQTDSAPYYSAFDVFAHPSTEESFGRVIAEALSCGLPTVISTPEEPDSTEEEGYGIIRNGINGIVVGNDKKTFCEGVVNLVHNKELRMRFARGACASVQQFDARFMAQRYHEVFTAAAAQPRVPRLNRLKELADLLHPQDFLTAGKQEMHVQQGEKP